MLEKLSFIQAIHNSVRKPSSKDIDSRRGEFFHRYQNSDDDKQEELRDNSIVLMNSKLILLL
jgi:hypothetical protein